MQPIKQKKHAGFTLIELLVAISIIGILAGLLLTNFAGVRGRAADVKKKSDLQQVKKALRLYYNDYQKYPGSGSAHLIYGCGVNGWDQCSTTFTAGANSTVYMKALPTGLRYYSDNAERFAILVALENLSDTEITNSQAACATSLTAVGATAAAADYVVCDE